MKKEEEKSKKQEVEDEKELKNRYECYEEEAKDEK